MQTDLQARVLFIGEMTSNEPLRPRLRAQSAVTQRRQAFPAKGSQLSSRKPKHVSICFIKPASREKRLAGKKRAGAAIKRSGAG